MSGWPCSANFRRPCSTWWRRARERWRSAASRVYAVEDALGFGAVGGGHDGQDVLDVGAAVRGVRLHQRVEAQQVAQLGLFLIAGCGLAGFAGAGRVVVCHGAHAPTVPQVDGRSGIATPTGIAAGQTVAGWWQVAL